MGNLLEKIQSCRHRMKNLTNVFDGREPRVLMLGLDSAGKTTILYKAKLDDTIFANVPPRGINIELMTPRRGARIQVYDMPGSKLTRYLWSNWFKCTEAVVYVVDSADSVRIDEAKFELHELLQSRDLRRVPLIVVANKQDSDGAMNTEVISAELDLTSIQDRDWSIHGTYALKGTGIKQVFQDVVDKIKAFRHYKSGLVVKDVKSKQKVEKSKGVQGETNIEFTDIEIKDANDNEKTHSLFESIKKQDELKGEETVSATNSNGSTDSNPAEYDRPPPEFDMSPEEEDMKAPDTVDDVESDKSDANVKVTDLDEDSSDSDTDSVNDKNGESNEIGSVFEFEANAPVAVV
ncbi:ADP-ribosylation factor D-like [Mercenaria mercenaria]|uniref:ADP-ribosylation factor D-like n=1 Tax=Mercenaria mercenaria TaxID=6596 RepID=UPI001E1DE3BA|nr:ADP-ribosylation factor D-like [Mercenaria mercenaria]